MIDMMLNATLTGENVICEILNASVIYGTLSVIRGMQTATPRHGMATDGTLSETLIYAISSANASVMHAI